MWLDQDHRRHATVALTAFVPLLLIAPLPYVPLLFAAGMMLMDTLDGVFMTHAYRWALTAPIRRAYYNLSVTGLSVLVALLVGGVQLGRLIAEAVTAHGGTVSVDSTPGEGTVWRLTIPLTLAIVPALTVECAGDRYAIPQISLQELVNSLNALGVGPRDMISILQSIKAAGALQADIEVM